MNNYHNYGRPFFAANTGGFKNGNPRRERTYVLAILSVRLNSSIFSLCGASSSLYVRSIHSRVISLFFNFSLLYAASLFILFYNLPSWRRRNVCTRVWESAYVYYKSSKARITQMTTVRVVRFCYDEKRKLGCILINNVLAYLYVPIPVLCYTCMR